MAKATAGITKVERVVHDIEKLIVLELAWDEARALRRIMDKVGGNPDDSPRKHTDSISKALTAAGVMGTYVKLTGSLRFDSGVDV